MGDIMLTDETKKKIIDSTMFGHKRNDKLILAAESLAEMAHIISEYMTGRTKIEKVADELAAICIVIEELKVIFGRALVDKYLEERYILLRGEFSAKAFMMYKKMRDLYKKINEMFSYIPDSLTWQHLRERLNEIMLDMYKKIIDPENLELRDYHRYKYQLQGVLEAYVFITDIPEFEWQRNVRSLWREII